MELVVIAGIAANGVIGRDGSIPWDLPEDLAHFKETTMGHPVIMGRVSFMDIYDRLGQPLPGRTNIVLTRRDRSLPPTVVRADSIAAAMGAAEETGAEKAFVAGGASVYEQLLPRADRLVLSELHDSYEGDTTFPEWDRDAWRVVSRDVHNKFDIVTYTRDE